MKLEPFPHYDITHENGGSPYKLGVNNTTYNHFGFIAHMIIGGVIYT